MKRGDEDMREGLDAIQGDMARHQAITGKPVTAEANRQLAAETFQKLDQEWADKPVSKPIAASAVEANHVVERKVVNGRAYQMTRGPDTTRFRKANERERRFLARSELLMTKKDLGSYGDGMADGIPVSFYSWHDRILIAARYQMIDKARAQRELLKVLEDSSHHFGPWQAEPDRKIIVG